jgi:hypothetical protein
MPALTSSFLFDVESRWRAIQSRDYAALTATQNQWWRLVTNTLTSSARKEHFAWVLDTMQIEGRGPLGGRISFEDMVMLDTDFTAEFANAGLKLLRSQLEDSDGNGVKLGAIWMQAAAAKAAYWPQKQIASLIANGAAATSLCYDGNPYFYASHPYNPKNTGLGTYGNIIASVPVGGDTSTALANLQSVRASIAAVKMPDGATPRFLRPKAILCPPALYSKVSLLTSAKFIAMSTGGTGSSAGTTAGGAADIEGHLESLGFGQVIEVPEFAGTDTTYYVVAQAAGVPTNEMSAGLVYIDRLPFTTTFYTGGGGGDAYVDAVLNRAQELEWHIQGRNTAGYGHPFAIFKCTA